MDVELSLIGRLQEVCLSWPAGFMTPEERKKFEDIPSPHLKYWIPMVWFSNLASKARQEGRIEDSVDLQNILHVSACTSKHSLKRQTQKTAPKQMCSQRPLLLWRPKKDTGQAPPLPALRPAACFLQISCLSFPG